MSVPVDESARAVGRGGRTIASRDDWKVALAGAALFALALGLRLWGHAQSVTADDQDWIRRAIDFAQAVERWDLRNTYQGAHPGVPLLWIATMIMPAEHVAQLESRDDDRTRLEKSSAYLPVLYRVRQALAGYTAALTVVLAFLAARVFGPSVGVLAGLLLAAEPFLVAHGQLFSTDALLASLMAISMLSALVHFERRDDRLYLVISGLAAGLAFSTKAPAIVLFGIVPLAGVLWVLAERNSERRAAARTLLRDLLLWGAVAGLIYVVVWPALWTHPLETLTRLERGVRGVGESPRRWGNFFLGQTYDDEDVPLALWPVFYPIVTALRLSPVTFVGLLVLLGLAAGGVLVRGVRGWRPDRRVVGLAGYVALFTLMMTISPKKLDRYVLPVVPVLVILGALGLWLLIRRWLPGRLSWLAIGLLGVWQIGLLASVEPYPLSFYNPLLGGGSTARQVMIIGWGEGLDQAAAYLNRQPNARDIVAVSLYKDQIVPLYRGNGARLEDWRKGNYLVSYVNMEQRGLLPDPLLELMATTPPEHTVWLNGIAYARIYRIPAELREGSRNLPVPRPNTVPHP